MIWPACSRVRICQGGHKGVDARFSPGRDRQLGLTPGKAECAVGELAVDPAPERANGPGRQGADLDDRFILDAAAASSDRPTCTGHAQGEVANHRDAEQADDAIDGVSDLLAFGTRGEEPALAATALGQGDGQWGIRRRVDAEDRDAPARAIGQGHDPGLVADGAVRDDEELVLSARAQFLSQQLFEGRAELGPTPRRDRANPLRHRPTGQLGHPVPALGVPLEACVEGGHEHVVVVAHAGDQATRRPLGGRPLLARHRTRAVHQEDQRTRDANARGHRRCRGWCADWGYHGGQPGRAPVACLAEDHLSTDAQARRCAADHDQVAIGHDRARELGDLPAPFGRHRDVVGGRAELDPGRGRQFEGRPVAHLGADCLWTGVGRCLVLVSAGVARRSRQRDAQGGRAIRLAARHHDQLGRHAQRDAGRDPRDFQAQDAAATVVHEHGSPAGLLGALELVASLLPLAQDSHDLLVAEVHRHTVHGGIARDREGVARIDHTAPVEACAAWLTRNRELMLDA